uniref:Cyclin N-terminal domain-containing protein n=1 Tax=Cyanistes caeruleus TaxID=156563 RepID=A0A8C0ZG81_CYACU
RPSLALPCSPAPQPIPPTRGVRHKQCQAFSDVLLESEDPDMEDCNDPNLYSNYVKDIYNYLIPRGLFITPLQVPMEDRGCVAILCKWINLYCCFPQDNAVPKVKLQLVGVIAMYIASKYEDILHPYIGDYDILSVTQHMAKNVINVNKCAAKQKVRTLGCRVVGEVCVVMCRYMAH